MSLSPADVRLVRAFTAAVTGQFDVLRAEHARELEDNGALARDENGARAGGERGARERRWREMLLQVHVFAGFPRLVEVHGLLALDAELGADEHEADADPATFRARGRALFERIYADDAGAVREKLSRAHADFARWIEEHAYGRVLARPGLAADRRELLAVGALAALGQERQLASHARGARRCGASAAEVRAVLDAIADLVPGERLSRAREIVARFGGDAAPS